MIRHMMAILWKQLKDTTSNKEILVQFLMFPMMTIVMEKAVKIDGMPAHYFANLFGVMYIAMAPITSMASIISEEKEKNTLRVLLMSNVKPMEYLVGVGVYIWTICIMGVAVIATATGYEGKDWMKFVAVMAIGELVSIVIGALIGVWCKNQMAATSITVPVMLVFSFLPMIAAFNDKISAIAKFTYSYQMQMIVNNIADFKIEMENVVVVGVNMLIAAVLFVVVYRKKKLA